MYRYHDNAGWGAGHWVVMAMLMVMLVAVVVAVIVALLRRPASHPISPGGAGGPAAPRDDAERILAERFARGELEEAEYVSRRNVLRGSP